MKNNNDKEIMLLEDCKGLEIGSKAKNTKIIQENSDCKIPKTLIIVADVFRDLLVVNKIKDPLNYNWSNFSVPSYYKNLILARIQNEFNVKALVIRSSATCEDSPLLSFAGQYSSFLNITGEEKIIRAVSLCYQSLFSENAKVYAKINNANLNKESMAIMVQELVPVTVAGIAFTADPIKQDSSRIIIEYTDGLADAITSGNKKPIVLEVDKKEIHTLNNDILRMVAEKSMELEKIFGSSQDIEWGWNGQDVYIFQSRNITTLNNKPEILDYDFKKENVIGKGVPACRGVAMGVLKIIHNIEDCSKINQGDVVLINCRMDVSLIKYLPLIGGLMIGGGILSHIAVIAREFNIPCLIKSDANKKIEKYEGEKVIVDALKGLISL